MCQVDETPVALYVGMCYHDWSLYFTETGGSVHEDEAVHWGVSALCVAVCFLLSEGISGNSGDCHGHCSGVPECFGSAGACGLVFVHGRDLFAAGEQAAGCVWPSSGDWPQPHFHGCFQEGVLSLAHFGDHVGSAVFDPASESIWLLVALEVLHERK